MISNFFCEMQFINNYLVSELIKIHLPAGRIVKIPIEGKFKSIVHPYLV